MSTDLRAYFNARKESMAAELAEHVQHESPTGDKAAVDAYAHYLAAQLERLKPDRLVRHPRQAVGDILEAGWNSDLPGRPLIFIGHMDTVHPLGTLALNPARQEGDKLYGPGSVDMKGGLLCALKAVEAAQALGLFPARPVKLIFNSDEETGSAHSHALIVEAAQGAALAAVLEAATPEGALKTWRKSPGVYHLTARGRASHAGAAPEAGVNAIEEMAQQIMHINSLADYKQGTTVSVGTIRGGTVTNVVPDMCQASIDIRAATHQEMQRITATMQNLRPFVIGAQIEVSGGFNRPPMERDAVMEAAFTQAQQIAAGQGITLRHGESGGGSDANFVAAAGIPTLDGLGPQGGGAHTHQEYVAVSGLARSAALITALLSAWPA